MAKNWKVYEAVKAIKEGNAADITDIGRRFPNFAVTAAQVNEAGEKILACLPDYVTARKIESVLKGGSTEDADAEAEVETETEVEEEEEEEEPAPAKETKKEKPKAKAKEPAKAKEQEDDDEEDDQAAAKALYQKCKKMGLDVKPKMSKQAYEKVIKQAEAAKAKAAKAKTEEPANDDDDWGI